MTNVAENEHGPNLIEAIQAECNRVREILPHYYAIGQAGSFGAFMLQSAVTEGDASIASGDVVRMVKALDVLRGCEG